MSSNPELRVRLSTEGITEVINALRQIGAIADQTNKHVADSANSLKEALGGLREAVGALGLVTTIGGLVAFGKAALDAAKQTINASKQLGTTTEQFSQLSFAASSVGIEVDSLSQGLSRFQKLISEGITKPTGTAAAAFLQLGLSAAALKDLSLTDQLKLIADRIAALKDPADQAKASADLFGRSLGPEFLRILKDGSAGLDDFAKKADAAGATLTDSLAASIEQSDKAINQLKNTMLGLATKALGGISVLLLGPPEEALKVDNQLNTLKEKIDRLTSTVGGNRSLLGPGLQKELKDAQDQFDVLLKKQRQLLGLDTAPTKPKQKSVLPDSLNPVISDEERKATNDANQKIAASRLELAKAEGDKELQIQLASLRLKADADAGFFEQGLISLQEYNRRRTAIAGQQNALEVAALEAQRTKVLALEGKAIADLEAQRAAVAKEEGKSAKLSTSQTSQLDADITERKNKLAAQAVTLQAQIDKKNADAANAQAQQANQAAIEQKQLDQQRLKALDDIDTAEDNRHIVFERDLALETQQVRDLLNRAGKDSPAEIDSTIARLTAARTKQFDVDEVARKGQQALESFSLDADKIARDQQAGLISQVEGETQLAALQKSRIPNLKDIATQYVAIAQAQGNQQAIQQAKQFASSVDQLAVSLRGATDDETKFLVGGENAFEGGLESLLSHIEQIHSLGDAFKQLALTVAQAMEKIAAEIIAKQATLNLLKAFGLGGGDDDLSPIVVTAAKIAAHATGGLVQKKAKGDLIAGRGLNIPGPDTIPILAQRGEYIVRAAAVMRPGILDVLRSINTGKLDGSIFDAIRNPRIGRSRFATGGMVGDIQPISKSGAGGASSVSAVLGLEEGLVLKHLDSVNADNIQVRRFARNRQAIRTALGI